VGSAVSAGFELLLKDDVEIREYDKYKETESLESVVNNSDIIFVCVPTPMNFETGKCDTSIVESVIKEINEIAEANKAVVIKSTIPPGTTDYLQKKYLKHGIIFCPEFLTERFCFDDFVNQDRIILGISLNSRYAEFVWSVYNLFTDFTKKQDVPGKIYTTTTKIAEFVKYMANCFLATKVSFCNEMYQICQAVEINYDKAAELVALDKRIGYSHMKVPCNGDFGWGLSCFPKDLNSLIFFAKELGVDPLILESVWTKNLLVRKNYDWEKLPQVNGQYEKEKK
jgi:UDPglucose 6-dehydrogenase